MLDFQAVKPGLTRFAGQFPVVQAAAAGQAPTMPVPVLFGQAPADSVHFSGWKPKAAPKENPPYEVERPSASDRYSLGDVGTLSEYIGDFLENEYTGSEAGLSKALKTYDDVRHPVGLTEYRGKYAPVLDLYRTFGEQGYMGVSVPEQYGGGEAGSLAVVELARQLAYSDLGACTTILASVGLFGEPILDVGTEAQKHKYIPPIINGDAIGCFGLTEPDAGSDPGSLRTTAKAFIGEDGQRHWKLNGSKTFISNGNTADYAVILARTIDEHGNDRGLSGFIVERGDKGFSSNDVGKKVGLHTSDTAELTLDDVVVPEERLIGEEAGIGKGKHIYNNTLTGGRIGVGAQGLGVAERALDMAVEYARQRKQGGGGQIANYPEIREMLAKVAVRNEVSKVLAYHAARTKDAGLPFAKLAAMTKLMATELAAKEATDTAIQVFGGMGFMEESGVGKLWRDARVLRIYEGTSQIQKMIIAGQAVMEALGDADLLSEDKPLPGNIYEVVDQAFGQALRAAKPELEKQFMGMGHPLKALNAAQSVGYRLALIATEREALRAYKGHVERLQDAGLPSAKEEAILRLYARDVANQVLNLANEVGVPAKEDLRRLASVRRMVDHPEVSVREDLETVATGLLGESKLPRA